MGSQAHTSQNAPMMTHITQTSSPQNQASQLPPEAYEKSPSGDLFVRREVAKGILPEILEELLAARKRCAACGGPARSGLA